MPNKPKRQANGHYAVDWQGRQYQSRSLFHYPAHDEWVEVGHCPVVSVTKTWCSSAPHSKNQPHTAPRQIPDGPLVMENWHR